MYSKICSQFLINLAIRNGKRVPIAWVAVFLLALGLAQTGNGQPPNRTSASPAKSPQSVADARGWFRGNLHTHSFWSDGDDFPEMITAWYREQGYHFLALTDHNIIADHERWMDLATITQRGGPQAWEKYHQRFPDDWIETRSEDDGRTLVRLKRLDEFRSQFESPGEFLLLTGEEISDQFRGLPIHMNATNLAECLQPLGGESVREVMANNLRAAREQSVRTGRPILVHLNHPNFGWAITAEDLAAVIEEQFFEVYNGHPGVNQLGDSLHPDVEKIWDIANTIRIARLKAPPLFGLATDDCHNYHDRSGSTPGRGWIMVRATQLAPDALIEAVERGDFYASSGVTLSEVAYDPETKTVRIDVDPVAGETYTIRFVGTPRDWNQQVEERTDPDNPDRRLTSLYSEDVGRTFFETTGNSAVYQLNGSELYVRAVITSSADHANPSYSGQKKQAWTQPVGWR